MGNKNQTGMKKFNPTINLNHNINITKHKLHKRKRTVASL